MPNHRWTRIQLVLFGVLVYASAAPAKTVVVYPVNGTTVNQPGGMVVGYCGDANIYEVVVEVNGKKHEIELWDGVFDVEAAWREGENTVTVQGVTVTFTYDPWADEDEVASVHQAAYDNCGNCHKLGEGRDLKRKAPSDKLCGICHEPDPESFEHRNPEVACAQCHVEHTAPRPNLLRVTQPGSCARCHGKLKLAEDTPHNPPLGQLECLQCHFRPILNGLCHSCHPAQARGGGKPVHSAAVEKRACIVCHVPHSTGSRELVQACKSCHGKMDSLAPGHDRAVAEDCGACHSMHAVAGISRQPATACGTCHPGPRTRLCGGDSAPCTNCHHVHSRTSLDETQTAAGPPP